GLREVEPLLPRPDRLSRQAGQPGEVTDAQLAHAGTLVGHQSESPSRRASSARSCTACCRDSAISSGVGGCTWSPYTARERRTLARSTRARGARTPLCSL